MKVSYFLSILGFGLSFSAVAVVNGANVRQERELGTLAKAATPSNVSASDAVVTLTDANFDSFLQSHPDVFVDLDAPWCSHCQRLVPTWQKFGEEVKRQSLPVGVAKVDCMAHADVCRKQKINAFPMLRWYHKGEAQHPDFIGSRTLDALLGFAKGKLHMDDSPGDKDEETPPESRDPKPDSVLMTKCQSAGLSNGSASHRFSNMGGNEFNDYHSMQQVKIAPTCRSASDNARGKYNSFLAPCEFQFHAIPNDGGQSSSSSSFHLSTLCSTNNVYNFNREGSNPEIENKRMDYVRGWPDECVGDYQRCYSLSKDSEANIFLPHFCRNQWDIPEGVTHISVTCQDDKKQALEKQEEAKRKKNSNDDPFWGKQMKQMDKHHRERLMALLLVVALVCCCCWLALCFGYAHVVVPYLKAIKKSKSDPDLQSLVDAVDGKTEAETATKTANKKREHI